MDRKRVAEARPKMGELALGITETSVPAYSENSKVRVGCIGVGGMGTFHIREGLTHNPDIQIVAIADVYKPHQDFAVKLARLSNAKQYVPDGQAITQEQREAAMNTPSPCVAYDYREILANPNVDAVIVATPPREQFPIVMEALDAGKYVFCETPLLLSVEQGRALVDKCHTLRRWVQVGFQHRYDPKYNLAQSLVYEKRMLGRITHISAQAHANTPWRRPAPEGYVLNDEERTHISDLDRHLNWRLYDGQSGGLYTDRMLFHIDMANWFLRSVPTRVFAMGGLDYWEDGRCNDDNIAVICDYDIAPSSPGFIRILPRTTLMDEVSANQAYTVRFVLSSNLCTATRGVCALVQGDMGALAMGQCVCKFFPETKSVTDRLLQEPLRKALFEILNIQSATGLADKCIHENAQELFDFYSGSTLDPPFYLPALLARAATAGLPLLARCPEVDPVKNPASSAETFQLLAFTGCIREGTRPRSNEMVAFASALPAIMAIESRKIGQSVEIDPAWLSFDFQPPSTQEYDPSWVNNEGEQSTCPSCGQQKNLDVDTICPLCGRETVVGILPPCPC